MRQVRTYLLACANIKDGEGYKCWPSTDAISEHTGIHIKTVEKVRKTLVDSGWMQYKSGKGKGNCNTYYVNGFKIVECYIKSGNERPKGVIAAARVDEPKKPHDRNTKGLKQGKTTPEPAKPVQQPKHAPDVVKQETDAPGLNPDGSPPYFPNGNRRYSWEDVMVKDEEGCPF